MRLGQLARKYDVSVQQIISYLEEVEAAHDELHPNSKLDEQTESLIVEYFEPLIETPHEDDIEPVIEEKEESEPELVEPEIVAVEESVEELKNKAEIPLPVPEIPEEPQKEEESIETDRLLELLESDEASVDLDKITHIKAPKKELEGLKVVGKIDLPEPKIKSAEEDEQLEKETAKNNNGRSQRTQLSEEELAKRRQNVRRKKERQERRRKEREEQQKKSVREAHYKQKLQRTNNKQPKHKKKAQSPEIPQEVIVSRPVPKTVWGKFLRWLNT